MKIFDTVIQILFELNGSQNIKLDHEIQKDLNLDSIQMVTLLVMIEETFEILLDETDMNPFDLVTVSDVVNLVEKYTGGNGNEQNC